MLRLLRKFSFTFGGYLIVVLAFAFPAFNHDRLTGPDPLDLSFPYYLVFGLFWIIPAAIWVHEQTEDKSRGYDFLKLLPLKASAVVVAKFTVVFITILLYVGFHLVAFRVISGAPDYVEPSWAMMINAGAVCLLMAGILYLCIFRFGFSKMRIFLFVVMIGFIALPIVLNVLLLPGLGLDKVDLIDWLSGADWKILTAAGLSGYFGMCSVSVKLFRKERAYEK